MQNHVPPRIYSTENFDENAVKALQQANVRTMSDEAQLSNEVNNCDLLLIEKPRIHRNDKKLFEAKSQATPGFRDDDKGGLSIKSCTNQKFNIEAYRKHIESKKIRFRMELRKLKETQRLNESAQSNRPNLNGASPRNSHSKSITSPVSLSETPLNLVLTDDTQSKRGTAGLTQTSKDTAPSKSKDKHEDQPKTILDALKLQSQRTSSRSNKFRQIQNKLGKTGATGSSNIASTMKGTSTQRVAARRNTISSENASYWPAQRRNLDITYNDEYIKVFKEADAQVYREPETQVQSVYYIDDSLYDTTNRIHTQHEGDPGGTKTNTSMNREENEKILNRRESYSIQTEMQAGKCVTYRDQYDDVLGASKLMTGDNFEYQRMNKTGYRKQRYKPGQNMRRQSELIDTQAANTASDNQQLKMSLRDKKEYSKKDFYLNLFKQSNRYADYHKFRGADLSVVASSKVSRGAGNFDMASYTEDTQRVNRSDIKVDGENISEMQANQAVVQEFVKLVTENLEQSVHIVKNNNQYIQDFVNGLKNQNVENQKQNRSLDLKIVNRKASQPIGNNTLQPKPKQAHETNMSGTHSPKQSASGKRPSSLNASSVLSSIKKLKEQGPRKVQFQDKDKQKLQELQNLQLKIMEQQQIIKNFEAAARNSWIMQFGLNNSAQPPSQAQRPFSQDAGERSTKIGVGPDGFNNLKKQNDSQIAIGTGIEHSTVLKLIENQINKNNYIVNTALDESLDLKGFRAVDHVSAGWKGPKPTSHRDTRHHGMGGQNEMLKGFSDMTLLKLQSDHVQNNILMNSGAVSGVGSNTQQSRNTQVSPIPEHEYLNTNLPNLHLLQARAHGGQIQTNLTSPDAHHQHLDLTYLPSSTIDLSPGAGAAQIAEAVETATRVDESDKLIKNLAIVDESQMRIKANNEETTINPADTQRVALSSKSYDLSQLQVSQLMGPSIDLEQDEIVAVFGGAPPGNNITETSLMNQYIPDVQNGLDNFNTQMAKTVQLQQHQRNAVPELNNQDGQEQYPGNNSKSSQRHFEIVSAEDGANNNYIQQQQYSDLSQKQRVTPELSSVNSPVISQHIYGEQGVTFQNVSGMEEHVQSDQLMEQQHQEHATPGKNRAKQQSLGPPAKQKHNRNMKSNEVSKFKAEGPAATEQGSPMSPGTLVLTDSVVGSNESSIEKAGQHNSKKKVNIPILNQLQAAHNITATFINLKKVDCNNEVSEKAAGQAIIDALGTNDRNTNDAAPMMSPLDRIVRFEEHQQYNLTPSIPDAGSADNHLILLTDASQNDGASKEEKQFIEALERKTPNIEGEKDRKKKSMNLQAMEAEISQSLYNYSQKTQSDEEKEGKQIFKTNQQKVQIVDSLEIKVYKLPKIKMKQKKQKAQLVNQIKHFMKQDPDKMKVGTRLDMRRQFAHGIPDKIGHIVQAGIGINNSSPSYRTSNYKSETVSPKSPTSYLNQIMVKSKMTSPKVEHPSYFDTKSGGVGTLQLQGTQMAPLKALNKNEKIQLMKKLNDQQIIEESYKLEKQDYIEQESKKGEKSKHGEDTGNEEIAKLQMEQATNLQIQTSKTIDPEDVANDSLAGIGGGTLDLAEHLLKSFGVQERSATQNQKKTTIVNSVVKKSDSGRQVKISDDHTFNDIQRPFGSHRATPQTHQMEKEEEHNETLMHGSDLTPSDCMSPVTGRRLGDKAIETYVDKEKSNQNNMKES